jgi:hypothetical protein
VTEEGSLKVFIQACKSREDPFADRPAIETGSEHCQRPMPKYRALALRGLPFTMPVFALEAEPGLCAAHLSAHRQVAKGKGL